MIKTVPEVVVETYETRTSFLQFRARTIDRNRTLKGSMLESQIIARKHSRVKELGGSVVLENHAEPVSEKHKDGTSEFVHSETGQA